MTMEYSNASIDIPFWDHGHITLVIYDSKDFWFEK